MSGKSDEPEVVDLRESIPRPALTWGAPAPCPECGGTGYLEHIDMVDRVMYQHCTDCFHKYSISEAEIEASQA